MVTIETLINLINSYEKFIQTAFKSGYKDLRFFFSAISENDQTINIIGKYDKNIEKINELSTKELEQSLANLLGVSVEFWGEASMELKKIDVEEANQAPLADMDKTIDYFIDVLIPYSTGDEPREEDRQRAKQLWAEMSKKAEKTSSFSEVFYKPEQNTPSNEMNKTVKKYLDSAIEAMGTDFNQLEAAKDYICKHYEKISKTVSSGM